MLAAVGLVAEKPVVQAQAAVDLEVEVRVRLPQKAKPAAEHSLVLNPQ